MIDVGYRLINSWSSGLQGEFELTNTGSSAVSGWEVAFHSSAPINNIWNADIIAQPGGSYVITNKSWNATIAPGATIKVGFLASHDGSGGEVTNIVVGDGADTPVVVPDISIADLTVGEDAGRATLTVTLSEATTEAVSVAYATATGSAGSADFGATSGTLTFAPGQTAATVSVDITDDGIVEGNETFTVNLSAANGGVLVRNKATVTIADDDDTGGSTHPADTNGDGIHAETSVRETWSGGYVGDVFVRNLTEDGVSGWTVELTLDATIREIWNARIVAQNGNVYTITNIDVSASVPANGRASFGFVADGPNDGPRGQRPGSRAMDAAPRLARRVHRRRHRRRGRWHRLTDRHAQRGGHRHHQRRLRHGPRHGDCGRLHRHIRYADVRAR